ncbi:hypothetical protein PVAP13_3KG109800 [Panicum virgatum]|uniref:CCHC-type domain-containing protein n=1 Tax=Panicum virgatum TaxID=38727 RepID=A0A8T0UHU8_PANVG|nr:hypothetical protein PVAP13_3KG109800 [Panicum virgatum]
MSGPPPSRPPPTSPGPRSPVRADPWSPVSPVASVAPSEPVDYNFSSPESGPRRGEGGGQGERFPGSSSPRQDSRPASEVRVVEGTSRHQGAPQVLRSIVVKPPSYRDVVAGKGSYRSREDNAVGSYGRRFMASTHRSRPRIDEDGYEEVRGRYWWRKERRPVHSRLGPRARIPVKERLGPRVQVESKTSDYLQLLRVKAAGRCFRCLAPDHVIADCRDPPRCILCTKSGHKARYCRSPAAGRWRGEERAAREVAGGGLRAGAGQQEKVEKLEFPEMHPGNPDYRPDHVAACMARTPALVEEERSLELHALLAVQTDGRARLTDEQVRRDALCQLRISESSLRVSKITAATFLLCFSDPALRTAALVTRGFTVGHSSLRLRPWTRQFGAEASKIRYRVRLCLEGVPSHAWQCEAVAPLFGSPSFVEKVCDKRYADKEKECFCVWIWTDHPTDIAKSGTLRIEEPVTVTEEYLIHLGNMGSPYERSSQAELLRYEVLIHIDQVQDFSPPPASSYRSVDSDTSGLPCDEPDHEWPVRYRFPWSLGVRDGEVVDSRRRSVHDRLGGRRRDDSPPGGGRGGGRHVQFPPPSLHDLRADGRFAPSSSCSGGPGFGGAQGRQGFRRHDADAVGEDGLRKKKGGEITPVGNGTWKPVLTDDPKQFGPLEDPSWAGNHFLSGEIFLKVARVPMVDPMVEESALQLTNGVHLCEGQSMEEVQVNCATCEAEDRVVQMEDSGCHQQVLILRVVGGEDEVVVVEEQKFSGLGADLRDSDGPDVTLAQCSGGMAAPGPVEPAPSDPAADSNNVPSSGLSSIVLGPGVEDGQVVSGPERRVIEGGSLPKLTLGDVQTVAETEVAVDSGLSVSEDLARFAVAIKQPLLQTPAKNIKSRTVLMQSAEDNLAASDKKSERRSKRLANRPPSNLTVEQQATALLVRKSGILGPTKMPTAAEQNRFHTQFVENLEGEVVHGMRDMFGLPEGGVADSLSPLLIDAEA